MKLGIWKTEDFTENAQDADDEESDDDWSIKTFEDGDNESEHNNADEVQFIPTEDEHEAKSMLSPEKPEPQPLPHLVALPIGDTPDIMSLSSSTSDESTQTIYASQFDEYESDVFGSRLQCSIFFLPPSHKSDAGDSDMFYCVPNVAVSYHTPTEYLGGEHATKNKEERHRIKKKRKRKELDEQFLKSSMKKYAVQDMTIAKYGNATKAFRLRMAKLGKDPKEIDDKMNAKIERRLRRCLRRRNKKPDELTKKNVKKLPNLSKKAKIMRWVKLHQKNAPIKTFYENGWLDKSDGSLRLKMGRNNTRKKNSPSIAFGLWNEEEEQKKEAMYKGSGKNNISAISKHKDCTVSEDSNKNNKTNTEKKCIEKKTSRKRKKRKSKENMKQVNDKEDDKSSEESFFISKDWQISIKKCESINGDEEDEEIPKSVHSECGKQQESDSDDEISLHARSTPNKPREGGRNETPETEPEIEDEKETDKAQENEKRVKKHSTGSRWSMIKPGKI